MLLINEVCRIVCFIYDNKSIYYGKLISNPKKVVKRNFTHRSIIDNICIFLKTCDPEPSGELPLIKIGRLRIEG